MILLVRSIIEMVATCCNIIFIMERVDSSFFMEFSAWFWFTDFGVLLAPSSACSRVDRFVKSERSFFLANGNGWIPMIMIQGVM